MSLDLREFETFFHWANATENGGPELITPEMIATFNERAPRTEIIQGVTVTDVADLGFVSIMTLARLLGCIEATAGSIRYLAALYPDSLQNRCGDKDADDALQQLLAGVFDNSQLAGFAAKVKVPLDPPAPGRQRHPVAGDLVMEANACEALVQETFWKDLLERRPNSRPDIVFLADRYGVVL